MQENAIVTVILARIILLTGCIPIDIRDRAAVYLCATREAAGALQTVEPSIQVGTIVHVRVCRHAKQNRYYKQ